MSASEDTNRGRPAVMPAAGQGAASREAEAATPPPGATERSAADPRVGRTAKDETRAQGRADDEDDEDEWRHEPVAPVDERNPLKSLGRAVADVATGGSPDASKPRDR